ncbi:ABC transporter permease [Nocardioides rotundus]|uniref:ABC transporter permease n=1 Tax=Nocardioides rotundus TaxID=1774216 RepID=UPI001CBB88F2|nr:ABC transporter permease [Nocardioides rotundus]UAL28630.1 ABC transporter permease [Nocardioides rotundus]
MTTGPAGTEQLPPLVPPSSTTGLLEVFRRRYLLRLLVRREIQARYQGSFLGLVWSYINPLSQFFIYWFVMGVIMQRGQVENFAVHVFAGLIVVHFFVETLNAGTRSIVRNRGVVVKMAVPREMFPVASMLVSAFHVVPQLVILLVICLTYGWRPDPVGMAGLALALVACALIGTAMALLLSVANVFLRDVSNAVSVLSNFIRFGVPMVYPFALVQERFGDIGGHDFAQYYLWNPLADAVLLVQRAFWVGTTPDPAKTEAANIPPHLMQLGWLCVLFGVVLLVIAQLVFSRTEGRIPEQL